jgi:hypothetical protein
MSAEKIPTPSTEMLPVADLRNMDRFTSLPESEADRLIYKERAAIDNERREAIRSHLSLNTTEFDRQGGNSNPQRKPRIETFDAKAELDRLKKLSKEERKTEIAKYKKTLQEQREAMTEFRNDVEQTLTAHPDTPKDELFKKLDKYQKRHRFTSQERTIVGSLLTDFQTNRKKVLDLRDQFDDDRLLVNHVTEKNFEEGADLRVEVGPMNITIFASEAELDIFDPEGKRKDLAPDGTGIPKESVRHGVSFRNADGIPVIVVNKESPELQATIAHEQQHVINKLFRGKFDKEISTTEQRIFLADYEQETDSEKKDVLLTNFMKARRHNAYNRVKDEMFAFLTQSPFPADNLKKWFNPGAGYLYDYLQPIRDADNGDDKYKKLSDQILIKEYKEQVIKAITIVEDLTKIYKPKEIIALLSDVPLEDWSKAAARIYQEKLKDPEIKAGKTPESEPGKSVEDIKNNENFKTKEGDPVNPGGKKIEGKDGHESKGKQGGHEKGHKGGHGEKSKTRKVLEDVGIFGGSILAAGSVEFLLAPAFINAIGAAPFVNAGLAGLGLSAGWFGVGSMLALSFGFTLLGNLISGWAKDNPIKEFMGRLGLKGGGGGGGGGAPKAKAASGGGGDHH